MLKKYLERQVRKQVSGIIGRRGNLPAWINLIQDAKALPPETFSIEACLEFPAVKSAVDMITSEIVNRELIVERRIDDEGVWAPLKTSYSDCNVVACRWNPLETAEFGIEWLTRSILTHGFGAAYVEFEGMSPTAIYPLDPNRISRSELQGRVSVHYDAENAIVPKVIPRSNLIWVDFEPAFNRIDIVSPLYSQWRSIRGGLGVLYYLNYFFDRSGLPHLFFVSKELESEDLAITNKEMNDALQEQRDGGYRAFVTPEGYDVKNLSVTPQAADAINIYLGAVRNVARLYMLPPIALQDMEKTSLSSYNSAVRAINRTVGYWSKKIALEISSTLWPRGDRRLILKGNTLYGESFRDVSGGLRDQVFAGILSQDEARIRLDYPPENTEESRALLRTNNIPIESEEEEQNSQETQDA